MPMNQTCFSGLFNLNSVDFYQRTDIIFTVGSLNNIIWTPLVVYDLVHSSKQEIIWNETIHPEEDMTFVSDSFQGIFLISSQRVCLCYCHLWFVPDVCTLASNLFRLQKYFCKAAFCQCPPWWCWIYLLCLMPRPGTKLPKGKSHIQYTQHVKCKWMKQVIKAWILSNLMFKIAMHLTHLNSLVLFFSFRFCACVTTWQTNSLCIYEKMQMKPFHKTWKKYSFISGVANKV